MYCSNCGQQVQDTDRFCETCGQALERTVGSREVRETSDSTFPRLEQFERRVRNFGKTPVVAQIAAWFALLLGAWLGIAAFLGTMSNQYREDVFYGESSDVRNQVTWLAILAAALIIVSILLFWKKVYSESFGRWPKLEPAFMEAWIVLEEPEKKYKSKVRINHLRELLLSAGTPAKVMLYLTTALALYRTYRIFLEGRETIDLFILANNLLLLLLCVSLLRNIPVLSKDSNLMTIAAIWAATALYSYRDLSQLRLGSSIMLILLLALIVFFIVLRIAISTGILTYLVLIFSTLSLIHFVYDVNWIVFYIRNMHEYVVSDPKDMMLLVLSTLPSLSLDITFGLFSLTVFFRVLQCSLSLKPLKFRIPIRSKKAIVGLWIVIGILVGGLIAKPDDTERTDRGEAISALHALAVTFSSEKYEAAADFVEYEAGEAMKAGCGIGGILGGVVGAIFVSASHGQNRTRRPENNPSLNKPT